MYCVYCGEKLKEMAKYCSNCGKLVSYKKEPITEITEKGSKSQTNYSGKREGISKSKDIFKVSQNFIKQLARYFMDFLETDFHKRRIPKRSVKLRDRENLLIGMDLSKYRKYLDRIFRVINNGFNISNSLDIKKGVNKTNIPRSLINLVELQIKKLSSKEIKNIVKNIGDGLNRIIASSDKSYGRAINKINEHSRKVIKEELAVPFILTLEKTIEEFDLGDEGSIFIMEEELTDILYRLIENKISEVTNLLISENKVDVYKEIVMVFEIDEIKTNISAFFNSFGINDLYLEIYEMVRNKAILDKQELYLYFYDIRYRNNKYPIFYIPLEIEIVKDVLKVKFDKQVYINKKAIEFIVQEYNVEYGKKGTLKTITDRIIYLSGKNDEFVELIDDILHELSVFFELSDTITTEDSEIKYSKSLSVGISNNCYICIAEKSDESIVNDYEDILQLLSDDNNEITSEFCNIINDFVFHEPSSYAEEVEEKWDNLRIDDKLVIKSPIPLNREQQQILIAINNKDCRYILVSGPPGTGKSHTITAIVFNAILEDKSVLFLSDKKEALDVVEDKISGVMNRVRVDKNFQNPILRLGKTGSTYNKILSVNSLNETKTFCRVIRNNYEKLESDISMSVNTLKEDIESEMLALKDISITEIEELNQLEKYFKEKGTPIEFHEWLDIDGSIEFLEEIREFFLKLNESIIIDNNSEINRLFGLCNIEKEDFKKKEDFDDYLKSINNIVEIVKEIDDQYKEQTLVLKRFNELGEKNLPKLNYFVEEFKKAKSKLFGFLLNKEKVLKLKSEFNSAFLNNNINNPEKRIRELELIVDILNNGKIYIEKKDLFKNSKIDNLGIVFQFLKDGNNLDLAIELNNIYKKIDFIYEELNKFPETFKRAGINCNKFNTFYENKFTEISNDDFKLLLRYLFLEIKLKENFSNIPEIDYGKKKEEIERLLTTKMTYQMDQRVVNFYNNNKNTARTLRNIIRSKRQFPKEEFKKLKKAFPCILVGIRDFAEYIPLESEIFDLIIIDEASQVSIAQAFPALLRAKKIIIFGDNKQFSNVKAALARSDTNKEYLSNLESVFKKEVSDQETQLQRLKQFNIKTSILDFFEFMNNFGVQLLKYFRGYKEIISYSNNHFYQDSLQVMKIRGTSIENVLKFTQVEHDGKEEVIQNTNIPEADFIISELLKIKEEKINKSIGIITPHTHQQKLLMERINKMPESTYFFDKLNLKIMTFDTCQGEERDIIYYSMVATKESDRLWGVFIKDLESVDLEDQGKIKAQRLNVGFSRAKECMHFILSKPIEEYNGSIGEAIRYYYRVYNEAKKEKTAKDVDSKSAMEPKILDWFYQTKFWRENKDKIDFRPQFNIGDYLRQLDRTYNHPSYIVDFLVIYQDENEEHRIIIEYDGLREHFKNVDNIGRYNYENYYTDEHLYREKVIESYGYRFIRLNKFNIGNNPIETIDKKIEQIMSSEDDIDNVINRIHTNIEGMQNGRMKICPKCKQIKSIESFKDDYLISGFGRICNDCKGYKYSTGRYIRNKNKRGILCPDCGSEMVVRNGKYGKFYGCIKYPYCKGTRTIERLSFK